MSAEDPLLLNRSVFVISLALSLAVLSGAAAQPPSTPPTPAVVEPLPQPVDPVRPAFGDWLVALRKEALAQGISERTVSAALGSVEPLPVVIERDRSQAERVLAVDVYLKRRLDRKLVRTAREMARRHATLLRKVSSRYGVPPGVLVAIWGLESNFGRFSGVRPTVAALATLAYDNRRAALFRDELFSALRILDREDVAVDRMKGSWAGAMGQPQFMPSSYLKYAQDFDGDGRADIWASQPDVFASIANFLKEQGWKAGAPWGRRVKLPAATVAKLERSAPLRGEGCEAVRQMTRQLPWSEWRAMGVKLDGRQKAPSPKTPASLVRAGSLNFLVFDNYSALLQYNCAHAYALSVALLSERVP
jgi:membrane-bound lytic murein transglycosylase B